MLTQKYDVAVANPPYTDSGDFGGELKTFIEANYKKPFKFSTNLYATFIKRCAELSNGTGKLALIHPLTFMYIKTFEDVRKFILGKLHINILVDYGLSNMFGAVMVDPAFYVLEKGITSQKPSLFISLDQYTRTPNEKYKKDFCLTALDNYVAGNSDKHNYSIDQSKLKVIDSYPFIYWISDGFRKNFSEKTIKYYFNTAQGLITGNNDRFLRFWWENQHIGSKWIPFAKGGPFNKWFGNLWLTVNWHEDGKEIKNFFDSNGKLRSRPQNEKLYFTEGLTFAKAGTKGASFRYLPPNNIFESGSPTIFSSTFSNLYYTSAFLNSSLAFYILDCLNPTVSTQVGDVERLPFVRPNNSIELNLSKLANKNIEIKKHLCSYRIYELNFDKNPLLAFTQSSLQEKVLAYLNYENSQLAFVLLNEAIINQLIFEVYELSPEDRQQVEAKMGKPVGELPVLAEAREAFLDSGFGNADLGFVDEFIRELPVADFEESEIRAITDEFPNLYKSNNDLEEFCIRHQVNPINVWYWFKNSNVVPKARAAEIALEFLADVCRTVLMEDADGIAPLVGLPGETALLDRLEEKCLSLGLTSAQFAQLDGLLGRPVKEYLEDHFFKNLSDHLNLFMYLPKTPFIWHLSSGELQGFEAYIIIYKWTRDSLYRLKSKYISDRLESLNYRLSNLATSQTAQAQTEKETITLQLQEISDFTRKVDELIAEDYNPILDDGVGKNIAPLQKKGMLRAEVLNDGQLKKYLNADW